MKKSTDRPILAWTWPLVLVLPLGLSPAAARVAPDPLPDYSSLSPTTNQAVYQVSELPGGKMLLGPDATLEVYIWDIEMVVTPAGSMFLKSYELQWENGYEEVDYDLSDFPSGTVQIWDLKDAYGANRVVYFDEFGILRDLDHSLVGTGAIGSGGVIVAPPLSGGSQCHRNGTLIECLQAWPECDMGCPWIDTGSSICACPELWGACRLGDGGPGCGGGCGPDRTCQDDGAWDCGCQY